MRKNHLVYFVMSLTGVLLFLAACNDEKDYYNPSALQEQAKEAFPVKNVAPNHTWEMNTVCEASVLIEEEGNASYTLKVYTENPFNVNSTAYLLAKESIIAGQVLNFKFDIPVALKIVYVVKENSNGYRAMKPVVVENNRLNIVFGGDDAINSTSTRAVATRAPQLSEITDTDIFPVQAPETMYPTNNSWTNVKGDYLVTSMHNDINYQGNGGGIYIQGEVTLSNLYLGPNCNLYLLPGATLTLSDYTLSQKNCMLSVGTDATLVCNGKLEISNNSCPAYNAGVIKAASFEYNGNTNFFNLGELISAGSFSCENSNTVVVNSGKISAASFDLRGSSSFYNEDTGEVYISGLSAITSVNSVWDNDGYFRTSEMSFVAASKSWINRCKLYVDNLLSISTNGDAVFAVDGGGYVECGSLYMNMAEVRLGDKAFFNVLGTADFGYNKEGGFKATGSGEYALLKMKKATRQNNSNNNIAYSGKLYIDCVDHFEIQKDQWNAYYTLSGGAAFTSEGNAEIEIPESECNPGYKPNPGGGGEDKPQVYTYAYEDMIKQVGDYDFNDVVLYISTPIDNEITIKLVAAGAEKDLWVFFGGEDLFGEVHQALGVPSGTLVNTGMATADVVSKTIGVADGFALKDADFYICENAQGTDGIHICKFTYNFKPGDVPYAICVPGEWEYPKEAVVITQAYPDFEDCAQDTTQDPDWYNRPMVNKVY